MSVVADLNCVRMN